MARQVDKLTSLMLQQATAGAMLYDGNGLYFRASGPGRGSWEWRYYRFSNEHRMGLGSYRDVSLAQARRMTLEKRQLLRDGFDPINVRRIERVEAQQKDEKNKTFRMVAEEYIDLQISQGRWKDTKKTAMIIKSRLATHAYPTIGMLSVRLINSNMIIEILESLWTAKPEMAKRVCAYIRQILGYAKVKGYREGDNPAAIKDNLDTVMPKRSEEKRVKHHASLPYDEVGALMAELRQSCTVVALCLQFTILTTTRTGEAIGARWPEFDFKQRVWLIPKERMKMGEEHSVPLSAAAIAILNQLREGAEDQFVFPGMRAGTPISNMAMLMLLRRMKRGDLTVHGFRATFRTWVEECTDYPPHLAEIALAHGSEAAKLAGVDPALWRAYQRGKLLDKRRPLMDDWAEFVSKLNGKSEGDLKEAAD